MNLEGKTVLVVGAGRGIGRGAAELFSDAGCNVVLSSRNEVELLELEYKLNRKGNANVLSFEADACVETDVRALVDASLERFGSIDYLVHAAGLGILKPFGELNLEDFDLLMNANVRTAFNVLQAVLPVMPVSAYFAAQ
jgi:NAD(P)-dependent dehydrogenase (short-subunit alcohol dehydrogenase family)